MRGQEGSQNVTAIFNDRTLQVLENMGRELGSLAESMKNMYVTCEETLQVVKNQQDETRMIMQATRDNREALQKVLDKQEDQFRTMMDRQRDSFGLSGASSGPRFSPNPSMSFSRLSGSSPEFQPRTSTAMSQQEGYKPVLDTIHRWESSHPTPQERVKY